MKTGCFLSPFIDTVDAKVCIFNLQSISQAERHGRSINVAPERVLGPHGERDHELQLVYCAMLFRGMRRTRIRRIREWAVVGGGLPAQDAWSRILFPVSLELTDFDSMVQWI